MKSGQIRSSNRCLFRDRGFLRHTQLFDRSLLHKNGFHVQMRNFRLIQRHFTIAAITTAAAAFAEVIGASVLGAVHANARGFLLADAARKRH